MTVTTDGGRRAAEHKSGKPHSAGRRTDGGFCRSTVLGFLPSVLCLLFLSTGCKNRALDEAQQETREAKATINRLNYNLKTAGEEIATVKAELAAVRQDRDDLQKRLSELALERDNASVSARQAQEAIARLTSQASGQGNITAALQKQVAELRTLVEDQQKLIEQLQKSAVEAAPAKEASPPTEPNQPL